MTDVLVHKLTNNDFLNSKSENYMDDQQELLSLVTRRTNNYVIITDQHGLTEWVNESFEKYTGYTLEEIKGRKPGDILQGPETDPETVSYMSNRLKNNRSFTCDLLNYTKKKEKYWVNVTCQPIKNKAGEVIRFFALQINITEHKWLIENLIQERKKAEESDRLKSAFLANMSHEIRTPMNAIMGFSELLSRPNLSIAKREEFANLIRQRSKDLLNIVNDILDISKIESDQIESMKSVGNIQEMLDQLLKNFLADLNHLHEKSIEVTTHNDLKGNENIVLADFVRLRQVFTNLLNNALKFTEHGSIDFGCTLHDQNTLKFFVRDTGIGIDPAKHEIIFKPFHQASAGTHQQYGGTGLGLAIIKGLLKIWNGKIWVESELSKGASFFFTMPYLPQHQSSYAEKIISENLNWQDINILLVDADEYSASYMKEILAHSQCQITPIASGIKALEITNQTRPALVLIDLSLPDLPGMKVIEQLKKSYPEIAVVPVTAFSTAEHKTKAMELGCRAFLTKPISQKRLIRTLTPIVSQIRNYRSHGLPF